jgi:hypothetical protein
LANKRKDISNRENKVKQKTGYFNIAIDTAQAIVASLRTDPTGIPPLIHWSIRSGSNWWSS